MRDPFLAVSRLDAGDLTGNLISLRGAFAKAPALPLRQKNARGETGTTGIVQFGWSDTTVHLLADLDDDHIFTQASRLNDLVWRLGDCLEIFIQSPQTSAYLEFHVAPNNTILQLLYPSPEDFAADRVLPENKFLDRYTLRERAFISHTWIGPAGEARWIVFASIDLRLLDPSLSDPQDLAWPFHIARYDYPRGSKTANLSSTSLFQKADFHAIEEWGALRFNP
jgi:hypothetical protein